MTGSPHGIPAGCRDGADERCADPGERRRAPGACGRTPGWLHRRGRCLTLVVGAILLAGIYGASAAPATAGTWTQLVCAANGPAPTDGMAPLSAGTAATATDRCNPGTGGLVALVSSATAVTSGTAASWTYTAPGSSTIAGGAISLSLFAPGGIAYVATPAATFDGADTIASCTSGTACGGTVGGQLTEVVPITHPGGTHIYEIAECQGSCPAGGGGAGLFAQANVFGMAVELANNARPAASAFGGGVLTPDVGGTQPLTFTASDPGGPGISRVTVTIAGTTVYDAAPDSNGGRCVSVGKDAGGFDEWLYAQPCPASLGVSIPVDTTPFANGPHDLRVTLTDAAGNVADVLDRTISTANAGVAGSGSAATNASGGSPTSGVGRRANGTGACATAHVTAAIGAGATAHVGLPGAATLRGTLTCGTRPVSGAVLDVSITRRAATAAAAEVQTDQSGRYKLVLRSGPSRDITVTYRAFSDATQPTATASARLDVTPTIKLSVKPGRVRNGQTITYSGQVLGGYIPASGLPLDVEYRDGQRWRIFDTTRAARAKAGRFTYRYTFKRTTQPIIYTFRVAIPAGGVSGYPYAVTGSKPQSVHVDP